MNEDRLTPTDDRPDNEAKPDRLAPAGSPPDPEVPGVSADSSTRDTIEVQPPEHGTGQNLPTTTGAARPGFLARVFHGRTRRDQQLQTLQSGYVEMLDMMRSISRHLDRQAEAQDHLLKTLDHFPEAVEGLRNVGKATDQQVAVLGMVREQLEANSRHENGIIKSMEGFNKTLSQMDETTRSTTATIGDLVEISREAEDELRAMLERSEKRLTVLTGLLGAFGILAIGGAVYLGLAQRRPAPVPSPEVPTAAVPLVAQPHAPEAESTPAQEPSSAVAGLGQDEPAPEAEAVEPPAETPEPPLPDEQETPLAPVEEPPVPADDPDNVIGRFFPFLGEDAAGKDAAGHPPSDPDTPPAGDPAPETAGEAQADAGQTPPDPETPVEEPAPDATGDAQADAGEARPDPAPPAP